MNKKFETRAIPLQLVPVIFLLFFWVIIITIGLVRHPVVLRQTGYTAVALTIALGFGILLCLGLISLFFHKVIVERDGITFQTPYVRLIRYKPFPIHVSFDDVQVKLLWGGRVLVFVGVRELKWSKRALLFGGTWIMPLRWKECIEAIKAIKPESLIIVKK